MSETPVTKLTVRNVPVAVKRKLKQRAARHGCSMEEIVRDILADAVKAEDNPRKGLGTQIAECFKGIELEDDIPELRGFTIEPPRFD